MTNTYIPQKPPQLPNMSQAVRPPSPAQVSPAASVPPVAPKRKVPLSYIIGAVLIGLVLLGGIVGFYLLNQNQDVRQQASTTDTTGGVYTVSDCTVEKSGGGTTTVADGAYYCDSSNTAKMGFCNNGVITYTNCSAGKTCSTSGSCATANIVCPPNSDSLAGGMCKCKTGTQEQFAASTGKTCAPITTTSSICTNSLKSVECPCTNGAGVACASGAAWCDFECAAKKTNTSTTTIGDVTYSDKVRGDYNNNAQGDCLNFGTVSVTNHTYFCSPAYTKSKLICMNGVVYESEKCDATEQCSGSGLNTACTPISTSTNNSSSTQNATGGYANVCNGSSCPSTGTQCVAIHDCAALDADGHCVEATPEIRTGTVDAQQIANQMCRCIQADVLSGNNGSCVNGHINTNAAGEPLWDNLLGSSTVCPNNGCNIATSPSPTATPTVEPTNNPTATPTVRPTPTATPTVAPSPTPTPTPIVCGSDCTTTSQCPQDHTCNAGKCQLTACVNGEPCTADKCRATACTGACTATADCPNGHTCSANKCVLSACVNGGSTCSTDKCRTTTCGSTCSTNADCPNDHSCSSGVCKLNACLVAGASCTSNQCATVTTTTVVGCNITCVNNSDCQAANHICVDTASGRKCRLETNITSDTCGGTTVAQTTTTTTPTKTLPVAGSTDILKAFGVGAAALVFGALGFLLL